MPAASPVTRPLVIGGLKFQVRLRPNGRDSADAEVIDEVVKMDNYGLRTLAPIIARLPGGERPNLFDIGGNVGAVGVLAKSVMPTARLVAFEPLPENKALYERHLADNGFDGVVEPVAVKYTGLDELSLVTFPGHEGLTTVMGKDELAALPARERGGAVAVPLATTTLEDAARRHGFERVHLCKMDCEYGEWDIFEHADPSFWDRVDFLAGEFHGSAKRFALLLKKMFPGRPTAQVATFPILGQFWVGPPGCAETEKALLTVERDFLRYSYEVQRKEAARLRRQHRRIVTSPPLRPLYWIYKRLQGIDNFHHLDDGPMGLRPELDRDPED